MASGILMGAVVPEPTAYEVVLSHEPEQSESDAAHDDQPD
jgi:hypothetical protein